MSKAQDLTVSGKEEFYWTNLWIECQLMPFLNACQQRERERKRNEWETAERWMRWWDFTVWRNWKCVGEHERGRMREGQMGKGGVELWELLFVKDFFFITLFLNSANAGGDLWSLKGISRANAELVAHWRQHHTRHRVRNEIHCFFSLKDYFQVCIIESENIINVCACAQTCLSAHWSSFVSFSERKLRYLVLTK